MTIKKNKHKLIWIIVIILLLASACLVIAWQRKFFPFGETSVQPANQQNDEQSEAEREAETPLTKNPSQNSNEESGRETEKDLPTQYEGDNPNSSNSLTGAITYKSTSNEQLVLRTVINQSLSSGTCNLKLTHVESGRVITEQANITPNPSSSTCEGFDIPLSGLASGAWQIEIQISSNEKTGVLTDSIEL